MGVKPVDLAPSDDRVLVGAVDLEGQSVNRSKYNDDPKAVISTKRGEMAAAGVQPKVLPTAQVGPTGVEYLFHADDLPEDTNDAHAEIRVHRPEKGWNKGHKINAANRTWLKGLLADSLRVVFRA
jgi:hypothetical protein